MSVHQSRRRFVQGFAGGALALGWNPVSRSWVTEARADDPLAALPPLDGTVHTTGLAEFAEDFGRIISRTPLAVLTPGSVNDVVAIVRFARQHGLKVAANGQSGTDDMRESHSNYGQAQVAGGIAIDMKPLATVYGIGADFADVGAGAHWADVFDAAEPHGLTPPVLTDYVHLSVGGTLSVGGISGSTHSEGVQADNVLALDVVTGRGELVHCSRHHRPDLFNAVLAGAGQFGIIVRAKVRLVPAHTRAKVYLLFYDDIGVFTQDQLMLMRERRFQYLEGQVIRRPDDTGWRFMIEATRYFTPPSSPDDAALLAGLRDNRAEAQLVEQSYREFTFRLDPTVAFLKSIGVWGLPHPWMSLFLPASKTPGYMQNVLAELTLANTGQGPILFYPFDTTKIRRPFFQTPREREAFHLSILRTGAPDPAVVASMLAQNRAFYDAALAVGGSRYIIGAIPNFGPEDWRRHYRLHWPLMLLAKAAYDPDRVLTPGQNMFPV